MSRRIFGAYFQVLPSLDRGQVLGIRHALALLFSGDLAGAEVRLQSAENCIGQQTPPSVPSETRTAMALFGTDQRALGPSAPRRTRARRTTRSFRRLLHWAIVR